jgi:hypothetical protein
MVLCESHRVGRNSVTWLAAKQSVFLCLRLSGYSMMGTVYIPRNELGHQQHSEIHWMRGLSEALQRGLWYRHGSVWLATTAEAEEAQTSIHPDLVRFKETKIIIYGYLQPILRETLKLAWKEAGCNRASEKGQAIVHGP